MNCTKVLLVDDDRATLLFHKYIIHSIDSNIQIETAKNGQEFIDKVLEFNFSLVLLDLKMPIYSGFEALDILRKQNAHIPSIIMVTTSIHPKDKSKFKEYPEIEDYAIKPINKDYLLSKLKQL